MQYQTMPFGWPLPAYLPLPPTIEDNDLFINSVVTGTGVPGPQGVGVQSAVVTENPGDLILTLTDGTEINAGRVVGPPGPPGAEGPPGPSGVPTRATRTITQSSLATVEDYYIGCDLQDEAELLLPSGVPPGTEYVIKLEYGSPVGNRKLKVVAQAPATINNSSSTTLTTPYQVLRVIFNNSKWWTI